MAIRGPQEVERERIHRGTLHRPTKNPPMNNGICTAGNFRVVARVYSIAGGREYLRFGTTEWLLLDDKRTEEHAQTYAAANQASITRYNSPVPVNAGGKVARTHAFIANIPSERSLPRPISKPCLARVDDTGGTSWPSIFPNGLTHPIKMGRLAIDRFLP